jgi:hypothetical protein
METSDVQELCEAGSRELMRTEYRAAEQLLARAEEIAWAARDWDTLARLYMPLQEARRQRRQRCGEGVVKWDLVARSAGEPLSGAQIVARYPQGQLLVAGWESVGPAADVRRRAAAQGLYVETFLAAAFGVNGGVVVMVVPTEDVAPPAGASTVEDLVRRAPVGSVVVGINELAGGERRGTPQTFGDVMAMWERLHLPFLAAADQEVDPVRRMEGYRRAIRVDYACELAHQKLSDAAKAMARAKA